MRFTAIFLLSCLLVSALGVSLRPISSESGVYPQGRLQFAPKKAYETSQPPPQPSAAPPRLRLPFGQGVQVKSTFDGSKHTGVVLGSSPDHHDMYSIAPYKHVVHRTGHQLHINSNKVMRVHKDDIVKTTPLWAPHLADGVMRDHKLDPPKKVLWSRLPLPLGQPAGTNHDPPAASRSGVKKWASRLINKMRGRQ